MDLQSRALALWLKRLDSRSVLTDADRAAVRALPGNVVEFATSRDILRLGEIAHQACLVAGGLVARFGQTAGGLRQLTAFYIPGDMADLHSVVLPRITAALQSASNATVVIVPHEAIRAAAAGSPTLSRALWRDCVVDAQIASEWLLNIGRRDARARIAHLLCELSCRYSIIGYDRMRFPVELTQTHLADATGLTPIHVNRMLRQLREEGAVELIGREAQVLDWERLSAIADFDGAYLHLGRDADRAGGC